jgi:hypothetical protein
MKIGDRVRESLKTPRMMSIGRIAEGEEEQVTEVLGTIVRAGTEHQWHVRWDDGRATDQSEVYPENHRRAGEPCLVLAD